MAARAGGKLRDSTKARIGRLLVGKRCKAALANGLIAVYLRKVWLVYSARANVLRTDASCASEFVLQANTPLHKIVRVKFSVRHCSDGNRRKTRRRICQCRGAGKLVLPKS